MQAAHLCLHGAKTSYAAKREEYLKSQNFAITSFDKVHVI